MYERGSPLERSYGWAAPTVGALARIGRDFERMVLTGGPHTVQVLAALLANPEHEAAALRAPVTAAVRLARTPRDRLLLRAYGTVPEGFQAALIKIGPTVAPRACYGQLHAALADPILARVIRLRRTLPEGFLRLLGTPVAGLLHPRLLIRLRLDEPAAADALIEALLLRRTTPPWSERLAELRACARPAEFYRWLRFRFELPFPPPPWPGDDLLEPVTSAEALKELGAEMRNCLAEQAIDVGRGTMYFYATRAEPRVVAGLELSGARWQVTEVLASRNRQPKPELRKAVLDRLVGAGFLVNLDHHTHELVMRALGMDEGGIHYLGGMD